MGNRGSETCNHFLVHTPWGAGIQICHLTSMPPDQVTLCPCFMVTSFPHQNSAEGEQLSVTERWHFYLLTLSELDESRFHSVFQPQSSPPWSQYPLELQRIDPSVQRLSLFGDQGTSNRNWQVQFYTFYGPGINPEFIATQPYSSPLVFGTRLSFYLTQTSLRLFFWTHQGPKDPSDTLRSLGTSLDNNQECQVWFQTFDILQLVFIGGRNYILFTTHLIQSIQLLLDGVMVPFF